MYYAYWFSIYCSQRRDCTHHQQGFILYVSSSINCFVLFAASEAVEEISWTKTDASICHTLTVHWTPPDVCVQNGVIVSYAILINGSKVCMCIHEPNDHPPGLGFGYGVVSLQNNECACPILYKLYLFFRYRSLCANWIKFYICIPYFISDSGRV